MTDTFSPAIAPSPSGTSSTDTPRTKVANFGDGYTQRAADGLNYQDRTAILSWPDLTQAQFAAINSFFEAHSGGTPFFYTLPLESTQMTWIWTSKQPAYPAGPVQSLVVNLTRVFDL